jgi:hypothetical protein
MHTKKEGANGYFGVVQPPPNLFWGELIILKIIDGAVHSQSLKG